MISTIGKEALYQLEDLNHQEILEDISNRIEAANLILSGIFSKGRSTGKFKCKLWVMYSRLTQSYTYFDFSDISSLKNRKTKLNAESTVKLWLSFMYLFENCKYSLTLRKKYNDITNFIIASSNFGKEYLYNPNGNEIAEYFNELEGTASTKGIILSNILQYLDYIYNDLYITDKIYCDYIIELEKLKRKYPINSNHRSLPSSRDIVLFTHAIDQFDKTCDSTNLKLLFMPVIIWWKLTTVIPMHVSEITSAMPRKCIYEVDSKFFLFINRVKHNEGRKGYLPILDRLEISSEIYYLIEDYVNATNNYGESLTLFSYRAHKAIISDLARIDLSLSMQRDNQIKKYNEDYFSPIIFSSLLDSFYTIVIQEKYKIDVPIRRIVPGDTRHFAFVSLLLQGLSEIEIALLGGHSTLDAQCHYQQGIKYYVDSQLYELIYKKVSSNNNMSQHTFQTLYEVWNRMDEKSDIEITKYRRLKVGWCTSQFNDPNDYCEDLECCYFCSKFWIEKTDYNLEEMKKDTINNYLRQVNDHLDSNFNFLKECIDSTNLIKACGDLIIERKRWNQIRTTASNVKSDCEQVAKIKYSLIDIHKLDKHLLSLSDSLSELDNITSDIPLNENADT